MAADYEKIIDAETWKFIRETERWYPADTTDQSITIQRKIYDRMCREFFAGYPDNVDAKDQVANGVPIRNYTKTGDRGKATVLYFHGGGFVVGGLESHDDICAEICDRTGFNVTAVDYRLAPEHPHPAAFDDCLTVFRWHNKKSNGPTVLVGDSAGANLAAAVAHHTRMDQKQAVGQVCIYGLFSEVQAGNSYTEHENAPMLTSAEVEFYRKIRTGGLDFSNDVSFSPGSDTDFSELPQTVLFSAECDPVSDESCIYCDALQQAGVPAVWIREAGLVHGYLRARHTVKRAKDSFTRIIAAIDLLAKGETASLTLSE